MGIILNFANWQKLHEQQSDMSNISSKVGIVGATADPTTSEKALAEFKKGFQGATIEGNIDETKALFSDGPGKWKIATKTQQYKDYLKIGDYLLTGDTGKPSVRPIIKKDLKLPIEASGNGIFALGRAMKLALPMTDDNSKIFIALNVKTPDSIRIDAETGLQKYMSKFVESAVATFVANSIIIPNPENKSPNVDAKYTDAVNKMALPNLGIEEVEKYRDSLRSIAPIDTTGFVNQTTGKKINKATPELEEQIREYCNKFWKPFITAYAERFNGYLKIKATEMGADISLFSDLVTYVNNWKTKQESVDPFEAVKERIVGLFSKAGPGILSNPPGAKATATKTTGTIGKIGQ